MKTTPAVITLCVVLSGCGSCQRSDQAPAANAGAAHPASGPASNPAAAPPVASTPMAPAAGAESEPPPGETAGEEDCIVIMDANPDYGPPPLNVSFGAEAECSSGEPKYTWDFGDGSPVSHDVSPTHIYSKAGDYTATVSVASGAGGAPGTDEIDIAVEEDEEPNTPQ